MSTQSASRVNPDPIETLADVVDAVRAADLPKQRGQEIASALRTATRAIGKPLDRVPADPRRLAALMSEVSPISLNISLERWANVRSLTRAGLALVQPMAPGRHITPLSPGWKALWKQLPRKVRMVISRFARFCSVRGIEPEGVTAETVEAFRAYLNDSLLKSPDKIFRAMACGWRAAQTAVESWPQISIVVPNRRKDWTLPWSHFPASLQQDSAAWSDRLSGRDLLADGPVRIVRPGTVAHRERQIRTFASALALQGRDPTTLVSLKDLVEIAALKTGLMFLIERSGGNTTTAIYDFVSALKAVARHHLHVEQHHLDQMARIMRRLYVDRRGLTQKNRSRLRHLDDPQNVAALLRLPHTLIDLAARNPRPYAGALQAQTAVAIEILSMTALRIGNLARLDLERNLVRPGRGNKVHIVIEPEDVKNREPLEYPLPPESVALIDRYLSEFSERFAPPGCCTALFPGRSGGSKSLNALRDQICKAIHRYTGLKMHPHLFRHATAKLYLDANPGEYELIRRVLGHRSKSTATDFYTGLEAASAVRHFDATILKLRHARRPHDQDPAP